MQADEVAPGSGIGLLFPQFVEVIVRVALGRYSAQIPKELHEEQERQEQERRDWIQQQVSTCAGSVRVLCWQHADSLPHSCAWHSRLTITRRSLPSLKSWLLKPRARRKTKITRRPRLRRT